MGITVAVILGSKNAILEYIYDGEILSMKSFSIRRLAIQYVVILIANIVLGVLVGMAFVIDLLLQDPIMAAVPAAIALPGFLLQPWYIAFLFFPPSYLISPIIASFMTCGVYYALNQRSWFRACRRKFPNLRPVQWLWGAFAIVVVGCGLLFARFKDFPALKIGLAKGSPYALRSIEPAIAARGRFYQLPSFLDKEALWQVKLNESQLGQVLEPLGLSAIASDQLPEAFNAMPPYWWRPTHSSATRYFSTPEFPANQRGQDGFHAIALWNPGDQLLYLWVKENF